MTDVEKTRDERIQELLDKPALEATQAIKGPSLGDLVEEEPQKEAQQEAATVQDDDIEEEGKKVRIPRSRLKTLTSRIDQLQEELERERQERLAALQVSQRNEDALPDWWVAAYGDDENSRAGYKNQLRIAEEITNKAIQAREEARLQEEAAREEQVEAIEQSFDEQMDDLEDSLGRELTANQKSELLDIVGEYSPQDADGQYTAFISLEKAYDIWSSKGQSKPEKKMIAEIASTQSSGGAISTPAERPQWGDWRKRLGG